MKERLTLTIEPAVIRRAKRAARERQTSLSALVEELLRGMGGEDTGAQSSGTFSRRWTGKLSLAPRKGRLAEQLQRKYGLT